MSNCNSLATALCKAYVRKIEKLEAKKNKTGVFLDEIDEQIKIDQEIQKAQKSLQRLVKNLNVVFSVVMFALILILVYISPDNSKNIELLC